jgi:hypothetical protein
LAGGKEARGFWSFNARRGRKREDFLVARMEGGEGVSEVWVEDVGWRWKGKRLR